jgi:hypothetical protein
MMCIDYLFTGYKENKNRKEVQRKEERRTKIRKKTASLLRDARKRIVGVTREQCVF